MVANYPLIELLCFSITWFNGCFMVILHTIRAIVFGINFTLAKIHQALTENPLCFSVHLRFDTNYPI